DLTRAEVEFQKAWTGLLAAYAPTDAAAALNRPAAELAAKLRADAEAAEAEAAALERLTAMLRDGHDLPAGTWAGQSAELNELLRLRKQAANHARSLAVDGLPPAVEATDWSALAAAAEGLTTFLARTGRPPSPATVAALTDPTTRERLVAAVRLSEVVSREGFDESWAFLAGTLFAPDESVSDGLILSQAPIPDLARWSQARTADLNRVEEWVRYRQVRRDATALGIESVVEEACGGRVGLDRAA